MDFAIPSWAIGIGFILVVVSLRRLIPSPWRGRTGHVVLPGQLDQATNERIEAMETEMRQLSEQVVDLQERLDFTERVLVKEREAGRLHSPSA